MGTTEHDYLFDSASDLGGQQLALSQALFDPVTIDVLNDVGVAPGSRCLELGAGAGSIARWMATRAAPGSVTAVDKDTARIADTTGLDVIRHDITEGMPVSGPFDVIHARLFLMHFPNRAQIFAELIEHLAPGGWLVVGDISDPPSLPLSAPSVRDSELFRRIADVGHGPVCRSFGLSWEWAPEAPQRMIDAGLAEVRARSAQHSMTGGDRRAQFCLSVNRQAQPLMERAGASREDIARFQELLTNPELRAWFYRLTYSAGQRPVG